MTRHTDSLVIFLGILLRRLFAGKGSYHLRGGGLLFLHLLIVIIVAFHDLAASVFFLFNLFKCDLLQLSLLLLAGTRLACKDGLRLRQLLLEVLSGEVIEKGIEHAPRGSL